MASGSSQSQMDVTTSDVDFERPIWIIGNGHINSLTKPFESIFCGRVIRHWVFQEGIDKAYELLCSIIFPSKPLIVIIDILYNDLLTDVRHPEKGIFSKRQPHINYIRKTYASMATECQHFAGQNNCLFFFVIPETWNLCALNHVNADQA